MRSIENASRQRLIVSPLHIQCHLNAGIFCFLIRVLFGFFFGLLLTTKEIVALQLFYFLPILVWPFSDLHSNSRIICAIFVAFEQY